MTFSWSPEQPHFNYPAPVLRTADSGATWYETHDGRKAARASKVVGSPFDPTSWYAMCGGPKEGKLVNDVILSIGTLTHRQIEIFLRNDPLPTYSLRDVQEHFGRIMPLLQRISNIVALEQPLYSPTLGIAGTTDCIADFDGVLSVIDFKTSTKAKTESDIKNYFLQATLYARMWAEMTGQQITQIAILMSINSGQFKLYKKRTADYDSQLDEVLAKFQQEGQT